MQGETKSGFKFTVNENLKRDFRFVLTLAKLESKDEGDQITATVDLVNLALAQDDVQALYAHVAEPDGTIPTDKIMSELKEVIEQSGKKDGEIKN